MGRFITFFADRSFHRNNFPLLKNNKELIYLDNAATTQKPKQVIDAMAYFYSNKYANVHRGIYKLSETATLEYEQAKANIAKFLNADSDELIFTSGTTGGINLLATYFFENIISESDTILLTEMEHHSNILPFQRICQKKKCKLKYLTLNEDYVLDTNDLKNILQKDNVKLLSLTYISNVTGAINNLSQIIQEVRKISPKTYILVDAAQAVGHINVDIKEIDCDFLVFSGHKAYGPSGIGVIYAKYDILDKVEPFLLGGGMIKKVTPNYATFEDFPLKFEAGTPNIAGVIGLSEAINYIKKADINKITEHEKELTQYFIKRVENIPNIELYRSYNTKLAAQGPVVSFSMGSIHPHDISQLLDGYNIAIRAGHHCCQILHRDVLGISSSCRVSFAMYNTKKEIDSLVDALHKINSRFR